MKDKTIALKELDEIHNSLINGQKRQMVDQINEYGLYDFFSDYKYFLTAFYFDETTVLKYFSDCVISYHRITNR